MNRRHSLGERRRGIQRGIQRRIRRHRARRQPRRHRHCCPTPASASSTSTRRSTPGAPSGCSRIATTRSAVGATGAPHAASRATSYDTVKGTLSRYDDSFDDYWGFLEPRLAEAWRLLDDRGTLYLHLDYREAHYAKVALDALFGRDSFLNELIWAYDYGAKSTRRWPAKHDTILVYVKDPARYHFDSTAVDREPYMAPGLVTPEKAARGKLPTDVWWHTIVSHQRRRAHRVSDPETGTASCAASCRQHRARRPGARLLRRLGHDGRGCARALGRRYLLVDESPDAVAVMRRRLSTAAVYSA